MLIPDILNSYSAISFKPNDPLLSNSMQPNYSSGYYDLSISQPLIKPIKVKGSNEVYKPKNKIVTEYPLITCEDTTRVLVEYFFKSEIGLKSGLNPDEYGVTYILGIKNKPHKYDKGKTDKTVMVTMVGKALADSLPNALPSEKNYGFKTNQKFPIFSREIESYKIFPIPYIEKRVDRPQPLFKETKNYKPAIRLKGIEPKHSDLGFKGRQTTKSTKKAGGRSKEFTNVSANNAYRSRLYKTENGKYQFSISGSGLVYYHLNNLPIQVVGKLQENKEGSIVLIPNKDLTPENLETYDRARFFVSNENRLFTLAGRIKIQSYEESCREYKRRDKRRRRIKKSKEKAQLIYQA